MEVSSRQMQLDAKLARASRFLIRPTGTFRTCWDVTLVTMVVYNAFALPFVVCFQVPQPNSVQVLDRIVDGFFYADLVVNFFSTYEVKGHLVLDNKAVAYHYLTHWFIVDLVGAFPFEVFAGESLGQAHTLQVTLLRGVKCIRLIRLARLFKFLEKIEFVSHFLKLLRLFFGFSIIAHWLACLWYLIGDTGLELDGNGTPGGWMVSARAMEGEREQQAMTHGLMVDTRLPLPLSFSFLHRSTTIRLAGTSTRRPSRAATSPRCTGP